MVSATVAVVIATYNRAALLAQTLDALALSRVDGGWDWELLVVDNNSSDGTRTVVESRRASYPVPLRYLFEPRQGRSHALNAGITATRSTYLLVTDDDVRVEPGWLMAGARALAAGADYVGGPVAPLWEAPPPVWLDLTRSDLWGTIAILDYGSEPFMFEERRRVPVGANMGMRRSLIERVGMFRTDLGRSGGRRVLGQEVPELLARARAAGRHGHYVPAMKVHHHIPASRLTKAYYRRWWVGKGHSKAILEAAQPVTELGLDLRRVPHVGAVPRFMFADALRDVMAYVVALVRRNCVERCRREMRLAYFMGFVRERGLRLRPFYATPSVEGASAAAGASLALHKTL